MDVRMELIEVTLPRGASWRIRWLKGIRGVARRHGCDAIAFGFGQDIRLLFGNVESPERLARASSVSFGRHGGQTLGSRWWAATGRAEDLAWTHGVGGPLPLASPWTSHRDHLGLRHSTWWPVAADAAGGLAHERMGGAPVDSYGRMPGEHDVTHVAACVRGTSAAAPEVRALVARLHVLRGGSVRDAAWYSGLTERRVRQLSRVRGPLVRAAMVTATEPRLRVWDSGLGGPHASPDGRLGDMGAAVGENARTRTR